MVKINGKEYEANFDRSTRQLWLQCYEGDGHMIELNGFYDAFEDLAEKECRVNGAGYLSHDDGEYQFNTDNEMLESVMRENLEDYAEKAYHIHLVFSNGGTDNEYLFKTNL